MARPKEFNVDEALDRAVEVFWSRGYEATSLCELVRHMKIGRQSLYDTFGDKHALFLRALDRFRDQISCTPLTELEAPGAGLDEIRAFFERMAKDLTGSSPRRACLLMTSAVELGGRDPEVAKRFEGHLRRMEAALRHALTNAAGRGELEADPPPEVRALVLANCAAGLSVMAKSGTSRAALKRIIAANLPEA